MTPIPYIRRARLNELSRLGHIEESAAKLFDGTGLIYDSLDTFPTGPLKELVDKGLVWVACLNDDVPIGAVIVTAHGETAHIEELNVLPEFGRRGIGAALLEHVCEWAKQSGSRTATLSTFRDIPWNQPFYRKHGFEEIPYDELNAQQLSMREIEISKGLPIEKRVIMRRYL